MVYLSNFGNRMALINKTLIHIHNGMNVTLQCYGTGYGQVNL